MGAFRRRFDAVLLGRHDNSGSIPLGALGLQQRRLHVGFP
jgi:hypothetical protein